MRKTVLLFFILAIALRCDSQIITTVAGSGNSVMCGSNVPALSGCIGQPRQIAFDKKGNYYITDKVNNCVWKVDTANIIYLLAGNDKGTAGYSGDGGRADSAKLNSPFGIAIDSKGNVFISDYNNLIRKVDTLGIITTAYGTGAIGWSGDGGKADTAKFSGPNGMVFDTSDNLYIADLGNNKIRKINALGFISTYAGTGSQNRYGDGGPATQAGVGLPGNVDINRHGQLLITDYGAAKVVRMVDSNGIITTVAGNGIQGFGGDGDSATKASFNYPEGVVWGNNSDFYVADHNNSRIRKVDTDGIINTIAGNGYFAFGGDGGLAINSKLDAPVGLAFDKKGNLYFADFDNNRIRRITNVTTWINNRLVTKHKLSVYPNPAVKILEIKSSPLLRASTIRIIDVLGRVLYNQPFTGYSTIDVSGFGSGIYNVVLICDGTIQGATTIQKQ